MARSKQLNIPTIPKSWALPNREYPITPRENLLLALNHQKPVWMPDFFGSSQWFISSLSEDSPLNRDRDTDDWFGVKYKYSAAQGSPTPLGNVLNDITEWEEKIQWPDLSSIDWAADAARLQRNDNLALYMRMNIGPFERMHHLEGFEQALVDLMLEPETVYNFLSRFVDYKIELFNHIRKHLDLDFILAADDWGTMRAPFFSTDTFEATLLEPTKRFVKAVQSTGTKFVAHCCGNIGQFIPYLVDEIGVDALEIQAINDIEGILQQYGDKVSIIFATDPHIAYDPEVSANQAREYARSVVDQYGACALPGSGVIFNPASNYEHIFYAIEEEIYEYSKGRYKPETVERSS